MSKRRAATGREADAADGPEVVAAVDRLADHVRVVWQTLDEIRDDLQWALRNVPAGTDVPRPMRVTSMALDPCDPEWGAKLNALRPEDLSPEDAHVKGASINVDGDQFHTAVKELVESGTARIDGDRMTLPAGEFAAAMESVDRLIYCCENPKLEWDGPPEAPSVLCRACGYLVAEYGEVVDERAETAGEGRIACSGPPKPAQGRLWDEEETGESDPSGK